MNEFDLARELASIGSEIAMKYFSRDPEISTKPDGTIVTIADKEIEVALRRRIKEVFPHHAILGEEAGLEGDESAPTWILDPIDGTNNFAWGIPIFATLIGLRLDGRTEIGVVEAPALGERYEATRGNGATFNGTSIKVTSRSSIKESRVCFASWSGWADVNLEEQWTSIIRRSKRSRGFGDFWGHMLVARGAAEVMAEPYLAIWDVAPLEVIVEEAGGKLTDFNGEPFTHPGSAISTNGIVHDEIVRILSG